MGGAAPTSAWAEQSGELKKVSVKELEFAGTSTAANGTTTLELAGGGSWGVFTK
jgi:hypothetical protein